MPLSNLRRPLFLLLLAYIGAIILLERRGFFRVDPPEELLRFRGLAACGIRGRVVSPAKDDNRGKKFVIAARSLRGRPFRQKVLAYLPKSGADAGLRPGQEVELEGRLRLPRPARNPGEFDEKRFLNARGISWILRADRARIVAAPPAAWRLKAAAESARQSIESFFRRVLPPDEARVFAGLTLGFKGPLRRDWNRAVQDAGAIHLLVPSGAKVAFVMLAAWWLAGRLGPRPRWAAAACVGGFYTLMVGAEAPYTRALWAGAALGLCRLWGRDSGTFQALVLAAWLTLLWDPRELFSAGFQMTYAAVGGLVVAMPAIQRALSGLPRRLRGLAGVCAVSLIVQAMLWPIFANTFGRGSLVGALANLLLVPASGFLMSAGFAAWLAGLVTTAADPWLGAALGQLARGFVAVCRAFADLPGAAADLCPMSGAQIAAYYGSAAGLLILPRWKPALVLAAASLALLGGQAALERLRRPALSVVLLRLPPAYPALASFSDGSRWLIGPGTRIAAVASALRSRGVRRVDRVVLTAPLPRRAWLRLRGKVSFAAVDRVAAPLRLCRGAVCFEFGGADGPRVLRGEAQYSIIPGRLKLGAVEVTTDGRRAEVR
ncbi:MAG: ComEC/Rec2 family competence protein [Elusimicrobia bacterium]|nr:ComEC/Rec2 family competence protein [Elusimicrobiota bacterium]